jgi:hypothetical protein
MDRYYGWFVTVPSKSSNMPAKLEAGITEISRAAEDDLLGRPWFNRVWVFQELVLSRDPWVQCGGVRVRWTDLCDLLLSNNSKRSGFKVMKEMHFARVGAYGPIYSTCYFHDEGSELQMRGT